MVVDNKHTSVDVFGQVAPASDYDELARNLDAAEYEPLLSLLQQYRHTGRKGYPIPAMWRAYELKRLMSIPHDNKLVGLLRSDPRLRHLCGFGDQPPSTYAISRFFGRLGLHQDLVDEARNQVNDRLAETIDESRQTGELPDRPPLGYIIAIDSTDIEAWVDTQKRPFSDLEASWGIRTNGNAPDGKEYFYGYKLHLICDAYYGVPLAYLVLPANRSDSPTLPQLIDNLLKEHPHIKPRYLLADKGYDALSNYQHLDKLGIIPIIPLRDTDKDGLYDRKGRPKCFGGKRMEYAGTDRIKGHLFRCPQQGCRLKDKTGLTTYCDIEYYEELDGDALRKVGRLVRTTRLWKKLYKMRSTIERLFRSLKHSRLLNQHQYRGLAKVRLHASLALLTYSTTMLVRAQDGDYERIRRMRIHLPTVQQVPADQMMLAA